MNRFVKAIKVVSQLGLQQTSLYALYQLGLRTGYFQRIQSQPFEQLDGLQFEPLFPLPDEEKIHSLIGDAVIQELFSQADVIVEENKYPQFGGPLTEINLTPPVEDLQDWTAYETGKAKVNTEDIKFVWEPARFGWAVTLARAYHLSSNKKYADKFWELFDVFCQENPHPQGPNWQSGQEVAVRLVTVLLCAPVFLKQDRQAEEHQNKLVKFIARHAARIPLTLIYARSQHNNHLITEALGLLCAGYALPVHPQAQHWHKLGKYWLEQAFRTQITNTGEYVQYSNNYHRVMLQSATLAQRLLRVNGDGFSPDVLEKLKTSTLFLASEVDQASGRVANYGHNDGAYLFPFDAGGFSDYRPTVQAAAREFLGTCAFQPGNWDEMLLWFGIEPIAKQQIEISSNASLSSNHSYSKMRGHIYHSRPGHADQNHVDLWWKGQPIALDPGTYRYNDAPPWDNQLMTSQVHNTISIDGLDQMTRAGRFLWLDWSSAHIEKKDEYTLVGIHDGYRHQSGIIHHRNVEVFGVDRWLIEDKLEPILERNTTQHEFQLHWLLPDVDWEIKHDKLILSLDDTDIVIQIRNDQVVNPDFQLNRAGEVIYGTGTCIPQMGWYSPTYSVKEPALSFIVKLNANLPVRIITEFKFLER